MVFFFMVFFWLLDFFVVMVFLLLVWFDVFVLVLLWCDLFLNFFVEDDECLMCGFSGGIGLF